MGCELLDFQCLFVSEIIGSVALTVVVFLLFYFIVASKLRFGFDTTMLLAIPLALIISLAVGGFSIVFAVIGLIVALVLAWIFEQIIGNR